MRRLTGVLLLLVLLGCESRVTLKKAQQFLQRGRYQQAIEVLRTYYLENPTSQEAAAALWQIGNIYRLNLKDFHKARDAYKVLAERFPDSAYLVKAQMQLGKIYGEHLNDFENAVVAFQQAAAAKNATNNERAQAKFEAGMAFYYLGNFQQARIEYDGAMQLVPETLLAKRAQLHLAQAYDADGDFDNALERFRALAKIDTKNISSEQDRALRDIIVQARFGEASCLEELSHHAQALAAFEAILDQYPSRRVVEIHIDRLKQRMRQENRE